MESRLLRVIINNVMVYEEIVGVAESMMRAHQLRKRFAIDTIKSYGVMAGVYRYTDDDIIEVQEVEFEEKYINVQSRMNSEDFPDSLDWFDEKIFKSDSEANE